MVAGDVEACDWWKMTQKGLQSRQRRTMGCMSSERVLFLLFKLCRGCVEVCDKKERKWQKDQGCMPGSVMTRELSFLPGMHWAGATKRLQEISMLLQARLVKMFKEPVKVLHKNVNVVAQKSCLMKIGSSCLT